MATKRNFPGGQLKKEGSVSRPSSIVLPQQKRLKSESSVSLLSPHAMNLSLRMLESQNENLALEYSTASRRIRVLEQDRQNILNERNHLLNCLSFVSRSWDEVDRSMSLATGKSVGSDAGETQETLFLGATVQFARVVEGDIEDEDESDDDVSEARTDKQNLEFSKPPNKTLSEDSQTTKSTVRHADALVTKFLTQRTSTSVQLAKLLALALKEQSTISIVEQINELKKKIAHTDTLQEALQTSQKTKQELESQLVVCKFQRDRAQSRIEMLKAEKKKLACATPTVSIPSFESIPPAQNTIPPSCQSTLTTVTTDKKDDGDTNVASSLRDISPGVLSKVNNSNTPSQEEELDMELQQELAHLKREIRRINTEYDVQLSKYLQENSQLKKKMVFNFLKCSNKLLSCCDETLIHQYQNLFN